ncbi:hypothetical protein ACQ4PT_016627 [Festuca glaucescens]
MAHTEISSPPRSPPVAGCTGGARRTGPFPPSSSRSAAVNINRLPIEATASPELPQDLARASAVCASWRSGYITLRDLGKHRQHQTPCLLYTSESAGDNVACLYSLVDKRVYMLNLPKPPIRSRLIIGSSLGLLVTVDETAQMHLLNPITGEQTALPSVTTFQEVKPVYDGSGAVHNYEYSMYARCDVIFPTHIVTPGFLQHHFHHKALVFYDDASTGSYIVVLMHSPYGQLSFARVGDDHWTSLPLYSAYCDCTYKDGLLYAVAQKGEIHAFDLRGTAVTKEIIRGIDRELCFDGNYIVQAPWGGLLLVSREKEYDSEEDPNPEPELVPNTTGIILHKIDAAGKRLVKIDCLPDHVLFLGLNNTLCLSAKEYPALKGNHAYFTDDDEFNSSHKSCLRDIGVLDLGNNRKEVLVSPQLWPNWPAPVWITPNLTMMKHTSNNSCLDRL